MIFRHALFLLFLCCITRARIYAQEDTAQRYILTGIVLNDSSGLAIPFVHLWNESSRMGATSDHSGVFTIGAKPQDTLVISSIGYTGRVLQLTCEDFEHLVVGLRPAVYRINELVVRRFKSYESFIYQATHLELPESEIAALQEQLKLISAEVAIEADDERAARNRLETGRFGLVTTMGSGFDPGKEFAEKMQNKKKRQEIIQAKFNRELVSDVTKLKGDELTDFIALCDFSEEFLFMATLPEIMDSLYARLETFHKLK